MASVASYSYRQASGKINEYQLANVYATFQTLACNTGVIINESESDSDLADHFTQHFTEFIEKVRSMDGISAIQLTFFDYARREELESYLRSLFVNPTATDFVRTWAVLLMSNSFLKAGSYVLNVLQFPSNFHNN